MTIGGGFVQSGGGYLTTPATRAAARAAGTFGDGATTTANLIKALGLNQRSSGGLSGGVDAAAAAKARRASDLRRERGVAAKAALQKCGTKPTTPPRYFADHNITPTPGHDWVCRSDGWVWTMDAAEKVQVEAAERASDLAPYGADGSGVTRTTTTPASRAPAEKCRFGDRYTPKGFDKCTAGYHEIWEGWFPSRRRYCVCDFRTTTPEDEEGFSLEDFAPGLKDIGGSGTTGIILLVGVILLIISLIKR